MKRRFQAVKGTRDILPPDSALWNRVEQTARQVFAAYNYQEIRLPIFEETELFARSVGADTDIVEKEMYSVVDPDQVYLEQSREIIFSDIQKGVVDQKRKETFVIKCEIFIEFLNQAYMEGVIPVHQANENCLKVLNKQVGRWEWTGQLSSEKDWHEYCSIIETQLRALDLGSSLSLRPEATASVVRAYIEHGMHTQPGLTKLYYIGPMFRRERPQKGRFRQFYQMGAEVLGQSDRPAIDAEIIEMVLVFLEHCGLRGTALFVNSIGCSECRPKYVEKLRQELRKVKSKLGPDSQRRIESNPLRVLDSKVEGEQAVIEKLPSILDHLCGACRDHYAAVKRELSERGIAFEENRRLVRGLDYYMRTTFEITAPGLGAQNAVCGGGRYDGLAELLGGPPTKGIGWALGTDRLILALQHAGIKPEGELDVAIVWLGDAAYARARELARRLRQSGVSVEMPYDETKLKKALGLADRAGARQVVILGEDELAQNQFTLRDMQSGQQRSLSEAELLKELKPRMHTDEHR